jgi:dimethylaniline monooxygenase (N-oxide forming)
MGCLYNSFRMLGHFVLFLSYTLLLLVVLPVAAVFIVVVLPFGYLFTAISSSCSSSKVHGDGQHTPSKPNSVCIIGGGVAGLQAAKSFRDRGIRVTVFEANSNVGGVWRENYADYALQVPGELYEFPAFSFKQAGKSFDGKFPTGPAVQEYINKFVDSEELHSSLRLNTKVVALTRNGKSGWLVKTASQPSNTTSEEAFDYVVVCTGMYSTPHLPKIEGQASFTGSILHSSEFTDSSLSAGRRTIVVGAGKSAMDIANASAKTSTRSTLLFRSAHWPVPRRLLNLVPFKWGTYSRFGHAFLPLHLQPSLVARLLHTIGAPAVWLFWRVVEHMIVLQYRLRAEQMPTVAIERDLFTGGLIITYELRNRIESNGVDAIRGEIARFTPSGVVLQDGKEIQADQVVFATGFTKDYSYLPPDEVAKLGVEDDGLYLYKHMLPPKVPGIAFVGSEVSTFANILTHALQAEWLASLLSGDISKGPLLPSPDEQQAEVDDTKAWKKSFMPKTKSRGALLQLHMLKYHDDLLTDIKVSPYRKLAGCGGAFNPLNWVAELIAPYEPGDYSKLFKNREHRTELRSIKTVS